jgi:hypothetical protein
LREALEKYDKKGTEKLFDLLEASSFDKAITEIKLLQECKVLSKNETLQEQKKDLIETLRKIQHLIESTLAENE